MLKKTLKISPKEKERELKLQITNMEHDLCEKTKRKVEERRIAIKTLNEAIEKEKMVDQVADLSLEEFARTYTKRIPVREQDRFGKITVKKDENGNPVTEEHNCFDDWIEHKKLRQKWSAEPYVHPMSPHDRQFGDN